MEIAVETIEAVRTNTSREPEGHDTHGRRWRLDEPPNTTIAGPAMMLPFLLREVSFTDEQHARIRQIMDVYRATSREIMGQLRAAQEKLADKLFTSARFQESDLRSDAQEVSRLRNQRAEEDLKIMLEIREVLTPEQLTKAAQLRRQMQAHRSEMGKLIGRSH